MESLVGRTLPASYREFLGVMGEDTAGIVIGGDFGLTTNIDRVIDDHRRSYPIMKAGYAKAGLIPISVGGIDFDISLQLTDGEPTLVVSEGVSVYSRYARSLEVALHRLAFRHFERERFPVSCWYRGRPRERQVEQTRAVAERHGVRTLWFSDDTAYCGETGACSLYAIEYADEGCWLWVNGPNEVEVRAWAAPIVELVGFVEGRRQPTP